MCRESRRSTRRCNLALEKQYQYPNWGRIVPSIVPVILGKEFYPTAKGINYVFGYLGPDSAENFYTVGENGERTLSLMIVTSEKDFGAKVYKIPEPDATITQEALERECVPANIHREIEYGQKATIPMEDANEGRFRLIVRHCGEAMSYN